MTAPINATLAASLFGASTSADAGISADLLSAAARARNSASVDTSAAARDPNAPLAPVWRPGLTPGSAALVARAEAGKPFFDVNAKLFSDLGATGDYRRLFALHTGLSTLAALAGKAGEEGLKAAQAAQVQKQFSRGLEELNTFFSKQSFEDVRLARGDRVDEAQTSLALPSLSEDYLTGVIHKGALSDAVRGLASDAQFTITATSQGGTVRNVAIDLADMGSLPRSLSNVVSFINQKLTAAGAASRVETIDQTPKTSTIVIGGKPTQTRYTGAKQYALKIDVRSGERVSLAAPASTPAFYAVGQAGSASRLIKFSDVGGGAGQPVWLQRPAATADPIGANVATGWLGPGAPYASAPTGSYELKSGVLASAGANGFEDKLRAAGEAVLKLDLPDGRVISVSTAWRAGDQEAWRARAGESSDRAMLDDLAERLSQLLHEQGVAAGVDIWENGTDVGLSVRAGDFVKVSSLSIGGKAATFSVVDPPGMVGGLRDGIFARRFEVAGTAGASDLFTGVQSVTLTTTTGAETISVDGGTTGVDAASLAASFNQKLRERGLDAAASLVDDGGLLTLRLDALHSVTDVSASLNGAAHDLDLAAPGAWAVGGLPAAVAGEPFGDALRGYALASPPLATYPDALDIAIDVATPGGSKTVTVSISALERANDPDPAPGEWSAAFQARLDAALNAAGVYVAADGRDLTHWRTGEGAGHRITALRINGDNIAITSEATAFGLGGAFSAERSFTSAEAASGVSDDVTALVSDPNLAVTLNTIWGARTVTASLQVGDPRTLESAALRLNEALASAGYDVGAVAVDLAGGGSGLRFVTGASHTMRTVGTVSLGAAAHAASLDPIDSQSHGDDPVGAARVAERAARGAAVTETIPSNSTFIAPSVNSSAWFAGRAWDASVGGGAKLAATRAVAAGPDGAVFVLADIGGDSATTPIKGARDVALLKYDSAGKLLYSRILGASGAANGYALAVSAEGKIAVAGSVEGGLSGATDARGGTDSFVTLFDADGDEIWTARRAASGNDEVSALAFAPDGGVIVAGKTDSALGPSLALGGADAYVRGFSTAGVELFTRQFGGGGGDAATALLVRDDGAGGAEIYTGGVENNRGIVRRFTYSASAGFAAGAQRDIGLFEKGAIHALAYQGGAIFVGGETGADRLNLGAVARASAAGQDGFVARLDADLTAMALDRASYLGSARDDAVRALSVVNGEIYAAGGAGGIIAGQGNSGSVSAFLSRLDAAGEVAWTRTFNSSSGAFSLRGVAVDANGASALDVLGLPRGEVAARDKTALVGRSALRAGDEFSVGAEGQRPILVRIGKEDTLQSLAGAINRAIGASGRARVVKEDGAERLTITPASGRAVRLEAGGADRDALGALGLSAGIIAKNEGVRGARKAFGLGLVPADLKLDDTAHRARTRAELSAALSIIKQAYDALENPHAKPLTDAEKALQARRDAAGAAPEYYNQQLANYQAALRRLGG